jgi:hypothetical protein
VFHRFFACSSTGHWQRESFAIDGNSSRLLLPFSSVVGPMAYPIFEYVQVLFYADDMKLYVVFRII